MTKGELSKILLEHKRWLNGEEGQRANLSESDLSESNLSESNLRGSNLSGSDLSGSNLSGSDLRGSNLRGSNLRESNLSESNLSGSDLSGSNLRGSNLSGTKLPPPTMLLLCSWEDISDKLTLELMRYDASNHPDSSKFDEWAEGGMCPYLKGFQRCANFKEKRELWQSGESKSSRELVLMLFKEKGITYSEGI